VFFGIMVLSSLIWIFILGNESVYSPYGSHVELNLPDGSVVKLNADSHIQYNKVLWSYNRRVTLKGEALFKVKKGEKFSVKTEDVVTEVLGTTFNIYSRNNEIRVSCLEGRVGVTDKKTKQSFTLEPNQKVLYEMNNLESPTEVKELEMAGWTKGEFYFNNEPLLKVLGEVQRQYGVKIILNAPSNRLYTGLFYSNNLPEALDLICTPLNLKWSLQNGVVTITNQQ
jgi:ferric-dicitrate binding protein FerR (iron transport regulator)